MPMVWFSLSLSLSLSLFIQFFFTDPVVTLANLKHFLDDGPFGGKTNDTITEPYPGTIEVVGDNVDRAFETPTISQSGNPFVRYDNPVPMLAVPRETLFFFFFLFLFSECYLLTVRQEFICSSMGLKTLRWQEE